MIWQNPWAWAGLALLALPVLVHLLSRAPADVRPFPSLRFIEATRLPPRRRTRVRDVPLLLARLGILAAAVAALAQPLVRRDRANAPDMVRAIIVDTSVSMQRPMLSRSESAADSALRMAAVSAADASHSVVIATADPEGALAGAAAWLRQQRGRHELTIVSDFQRGTIDSLALRTVPERYGIRLVRVATAPGDTSFTVFGAPDAAAIRVTPLVDRTRITMQGATLPASVAPPPSDAQNASQNASSASHTITMLGSEAERAGAGAAMNAALSSVSPGGMAAAATPRDVRFRTDLVSGRDGQPDSARRDSSARDVRVVYPGFAARAALIGRATLPSRAWMSDLLLALQSDPLLQDAARDTPSESIASFSDSSKTGATPARVTVARAANGETLVWAAQDSAGDDGALLLFVNTNAGSLASAAVIRAAAIAFANSASIAEREPFALSDEELRRWSREPRDSARTETGAAARTMSSMPAIDGGDSDARWLWAIAVLLLGVETWMRRASRETASEAA